MVLRKTMTNRESVPGANRNNNCGEDDPEDPYAYLLNQVGENQTILDCITATYFFELFYPNKDDPFAETDASQICKDVMKIFFDGKPSENYKLIGDLKEEL